MLGTEAENYGISWHVVGCLVISGRLTFLNRSGGLSEMGCLCRRFDDKITNLRHFWCSCCNESLTSPGLVVDVRQPLSPGLSFSDGYCVCLDGCNFCRVGGSGRCWLSSWQWHPYRFDGVVRNSRSVRRASVTTVALWDLCTRESVTLGPLSLLLLYFGRWPYRSLLCSLYRY
jgi:hypothetical protein